MWNFYNQVSGLADRIKNKGNVLAVHDPFVVFISYSRHDIDVVQQIDMALKDKGFKTILDIQDIRHLEDWRQSIQVQIARCDALIFAISDMSLRSDTCKDELAIAKEHNKKIIPVVLGPLNEGLPGFFRNINLIFAYSKKDVPGSGLYQAITQIGFNLGVDLDWLRNENILMEQTERWIRRGRLTKSGFLMKADMLMDALDWLGKKPERAEVRQEILDYIEASQAHEKDAKKRFNTMWGGAFVLGVVFIGGAFSVRFFWDLYTSNNAENETLMLALQADRYLAAGNAEKALMLALAADPAGIRKDVNPDMNKDRPGIAHNRLIRAYEAVKGEEALKDFQRLNRVEQVKLACVTLQEKTGINLNDLSEDTIRDEPILLASINPACPE